MLQHNTMVLIAGAMEGEITGMLVKWKVKMGASQDILGKSKNLKVEEFF